MSTHDGDQTSVEGLSTDDVVGLDEASPVLVDRRHVLDDREHGRNPVDVSGGLSDGQAKPVRCGGTSGHAPELDQVLRANADAAPRDHQALDGQPRSSGQRVAGNDQSEDDVGVGEDRRQPRSL